MTDEQKYIIKLSRAAIFEEQPELPPENTDWDYIWRKTNEQNIAGLAADAIMRLPASEQPVNAELWKEVIMQTIVVMGHRAAAFERMMEVLGEKGISPICLKGVIVKDLYPVPELRTMGDFDILLEKGQRGMAEKLFEENDYKLRHDTLFTEAYKNMSHGELFISLEDDFREQPEYWDSVLKQNVVMSEKGKRVLSPTYDLAYSVVHMAKHLTREGCGIRNILDAALLIRKNADSIDFETVRRVCESQGYEKIFDYTIAVLDEYFDVHIDMETAGLDTGLFLEYMLSYGVFGKTGNTLTKQVARREGDEVSTFRRIFFPPKKMIWHKYQYLKKAPYLLPLAWVHRFITGVFVRKRSVKGMINDFGDSINYGREREEWLIELGLM